MSFELPANLGPLLTAGVTHDGDVVTATFTGTADVESKPHFDPYMQQLHREIVRVGAKQVVVDLRALDFMNSSSLKVFVAWVATIQDSPAEQQYRLRFLSNPSLHWQRRSLAALSCFAVDLVTIET